MYITLQRAERAGYALIKPWLILHVLIGLDLCFRDLKLSGGGHAACALPHIYISYASTYQAHKDHRRIGRASSTSFADVWVLLF